MLKILTNPLRLFLHAAQMARGCLDQLQLGACRSVCRHGMLDVSIRHFVRVEFRAVARQVEHYNLVAVLCQPSLHRLTVVDPQVIQNQKNLHGSPDQRCAQEDFSDFG